MLNWTCCSCRLVGLRVGWNGAVFRNGGVPPPRRDGARRSRKLPHPPAPARAPSPFRIPHSEFTIPNLLSLPPCLCGEASSLAARRAPPPRRLDSEFPIQNSEFSPLFYCLLIPRKPFLL